MTTWDPRANELFLKALELRSSDERQEYLDGACAGDAALRAEVESLLEAGARAGGFLESPAAQLVATVDEPVVREHPGTVIGPYKLLQQIGEGGMGVVWMAEQTQPVQRKVALKVIKPGMDSGQVIARFEAERQALAMMDHVNIARVFDAGATQAGRPYFVMELVHGVPITRYCDDNRLTPRERLELFVPVCQAIQHAHQKGIIHRDVKPSNVMVTLYDGKPVPKVIDFGVAKATEQNLTERTLFTQYGTMVGTLEYMSPEQAEMSALGVDTRSDIYSLGVLLYELLTGNTPLTHKRMKEGAYAEILRMIKEEEPPKPSTRLSDSGAALASISVNRHMEPAKLTKLVRGELDWIVMKTLEKDRNRRYETANGFAADVQRYLNDETVQACPPSARYRLRKFARRNKVAMAVTGLVLFFLVLLGSGVGWAVRDRSAREMEAARQQTERDAEAARQQTERDAEAARQQTARHGKVAGQVESIFAEVHRLEGEQKWPEALAAARRAEAAVAGGEADAETTERVRQRLKDLEFIDRLEQIRMQCETFVEAKFDYAGADREYALAFRDYGVDVEELAVETSIERLKARPALALPLAAALDDWVSVRRGVSGDAAGWKRLVAVARGIDPESLRDRLRSTWGRPVSESQDELRRLAESIDVRAHHPATLVSLARTLQRVKHSDSALRLLRDAQYAYPGDFWLNFELGHALDEQKDHEGEIRYYTAAVSIRPNSAAAHTNLGVGLAGQHKLDEAIACFRKAIEVEPKYVNAYYGLANVLEAQNKPDEAIAIYRQANEVKPNDTQGLIILGLALKDLKRWDEAIACYRKVIEVDPKYAGAYNLLGYALGQQGKPDEAIAIYRKAIEFNPNYASAYVDLGVALERHQGKTEEAIAVYRQGLERLPDNASLHAVLADALWHQGRLEEAAASFRQAIKLYPPSGNYYYQHYCLGWVLREQKKPKEAVDALRKAIDLNPKFAPAHYQLGLALGALGQDADAIACYRKAIEIDPKDDQAYISLGNALRSQGKWDDAIAAFRQAVALVPNNPASWNTLGVTHYRAGNWQAAVEALEKSRESDSPYRKDSVTLFFLSMAHGRLNEKEQARTFYDQAAQWRMGFGSTDEELRRLCAEAAALLSLEVPPPLKEPPVLTPGATLLKPAAGATLDNGTFDLSKLMVWEFDWSDVPGATQYHLHVVAAEAGAGPVINNPMLTSSSYRYESKGYASPAPGWRWKVRALVNGIWTDWSEERSFEVAPPDDSKPASPKK